MSSTEYAAYEIIKYWDAIKTHHQTSSLKQQWTTYTISKQYDLIPNTSSHPGKFWTLFCAHFIGKWVI